MRKIKIANAQKRDAEIVFGGLKQESHIHFALPNGEIPSTLRILKAPVINQYNSLLEKYGSDENLADELLNGDPEINTELVGKFMKGGQRMLVDKEFKPVFKVTAKEIIYNPDGSVKEERAKVDRQANIAGDYPISWTGKQIPIKEAYTKFIFARKYQLTHTNGLSYDFLYGMAKELHEKEVLMLVAGGPKGTEPLIFQENGKPFRAFLEGRIQGESYLLLMHLSNLELKPVI